ncbi:hypothetical protein D3C76_742920 [compost metagenome]
MRNADKIKIGTGKYPEHLFVFKTKVIEKLRAAVPGAMIGGKEQSIEVIAADFVVVDSGIHMADAILGRQVNIAGIM